MELNFSSQIVTHDFRECHRNLYMRVRFSLCHVDTHPSTTVYFFMSSLPLPFVIIMCCEIAHELFPQKP